MIGVIATLVIGCTALNALFNSFVPTIVVQAVVLAALYFGESKETGNGTVGGEDYTRQEKRDNERRAESYTQRTKPVEERVRTGCGAISKEWLYPEELPTFGRLERTEHNDLRGLAYAIHDLNVERKRPFTDEEISYSDFGKKSTAYTALRKNGLIRTLEPCEEMEEFFTRDDLEKLAKERGISKSGNKKAIAKRLIDSGFKFDRKKRRKRLFRLTEKGKQIIFSYRDDKRTAIRRATVALKSRNYEGAVEAYREFDRKWGFAHTSGKKHTIFAHYDVPYGYFKFIERCQMWELGNSKDFKDTLRACMIAGMMRGTQESWELRCAFEDVCEEKIICPGLLDLFDYPRSVKEEMREQIDFDRGNALEYYISHIMYLCRQEG